MYRKHENLLKLGTLAATLQVLTESTNNSPSTLTGGIFCCVLHRLLMSVTYDFKLISSVIPGISLVMAQNEEAYDAMTDEFDMSTIADGSAPMYNSRLSEFVELAESAQLCCDFS